ncbi:hypothetical protein EUX98_g8771 [Antrodiella citrinella]|uniref:Uncharacterized protein n=1 Tax=Antrodiella citrinella TaxID=2447956 RepID=A0A4S4M986_9APHY|nr:hypothetical protein EUX98_g8771 [Antrodiella citrinella]
MSTQKSVSSRSSASSTHSAAHDQLVSLPSLTNSLSSLPQAKTLDNLALHQSSAESEAKLRKALSKSTSSGAVPPAYLPSSHMPQYGADSPPLMMRKPLKQKA